MALSLRTAEHDLAWADFARAAGCTSELVEMSTTTKSIATVLNSLIETCEDGQEGFRSAAEDVKARISRNSSVNSRCSVSSSPPNCRP